MKLNDRGKGFREVATCDNCINVMRIGTLGLECEVDGLFVAATTVCDEHKFTEEDINEK